MRKKNKKDDINTSETEQVSLKKTISYSFGFLMVYFMVGEFNNYIFYYYEVEIGLPVAFLGIAFIIFAIWNILNDPILGYLTDRPFNWTKKYGMRFPWIMIGIAPYLIFWWLLFAIPNNLVALEDPWPIFWYFVIMACLFDTFYSLFSTHINAGFTIHFRSDLERRRAAAFNATIPNILAIIIGFTVPMIYIYGDRNTMILAQTIVVLLLLICVLLMIPGIRESKTIKERFLRGYENTEKEPYVHVVKLALKNKNFVTTLLSFMLFMLIGTLANASAIYFLKDVLRVPVYNLIYGITLPWFLGFILFIPFWSFMSKKYGHGKMMRIGFLLTGIVYLAPLWINTLLELIVYNFIRGSIVGSIWINLGPVQSDVYDECTISTGRHQEAMYEGIRTSFYKVGIIFQAVIFTLIHIATGYNPSPKAVQSTTAQLGIRIHMGLIPSICAFAAFLIFWKYYDLMGDKQRLIKSRLEEMKL